MSGRERTHYETLGILPDAPDAVVRAAYKALSQIHHPDRHPEGNRAEANARMAEINAAYEVLSDKDRRKAYDESQSEAQTAGSFADEQEEASFDAAMGEFAEAWTMAREVYPEIEPVRARLKRISNDLAFAYSLVLLESKQFDFAKEIGERMERTFMSKHFGENEAILEFASKLVFTGERAAALSLNKLVTVVGTANPQRIIDAVDSKHGVLKRLREVEQQEAQERAKRAAYDRLKKDVTQHRSLDACMGWMKLHGYSVEEFGGTFFRPHKVRVSKQGMQQVFDTASEFIRWTVDAAFAGTIKFTS